MKVSKRVMSIVSALFVFFQVFCVNSYAVATELEAGSDMATAVAVPEFGTDYVSSLSSADEEDWFKFTTKSQDAYYRIEMVNYSLPEGLHYYQNACVFICDSYGKEVGKFYGYYGDGFVSLKLEKNTVYYIRVTHEDVSKTGNYEISVDVNFDIAPNEMENALVIETDKLIAGEMDGTGDVDWFAFTAPTSGNYTITLHNGDLPASSASSGRNANINLFDKWMKKHGGDYTEHGSDAVIVATLEKGETYYVEILLGSSVSSAVGKYSFIIDSPLDISESVVLEKITIDSLPSKITYIVGEKFDKTGLVVKACYSDGTEKTITSYDVNGFDSGEIGKKTVTVSYTENGVTVSNSFEVVIEEKVEDNDSKSFLEIIAELFMSFFGIFTWFIKLFK